MKLLLLYSLAYADLEIKCKKISISNRVLTQNLCETFANFAVKKQNPLCENFAVNKSSTTQGNLPKTSLYIAFVTFEGQK